MPGVGSLDVGTEVEAGSAGGWETFDVVVGVVVAGVGKGDVSTLTESLMSDDALRN